MKEWWEKHYELLIESGLTKSDLKDIVKSERVKIRERVPEFLDYLNKNKIPLIIIYSSGCGDVIKMFFKKIYKDFQNVYYITNKFNWKEGKAISVKKPLIHAMNKDETLIKKYPKAFKSVKNRRNAILLGDSLGDVGMVKGFDYKNLIKIGFLNKSYNKSPEEYKKNFDIILEGDGDFNYVNSLIKSLK
jgi:5'-nucleotidase